MGLTSLLLRVAARRPHVLVISAVGGTAIRMAVEASLARRGWRTATSPADADIVVVAGSPGPGIAAVVEGVWRKVPAPRVRAVVTRAEDVDSRLDGAASELADPVHQRLQAHPDDTVGATAGPASNHDEGNGEHDGDHGHEDHNGHRMDHGDHGDHGGDHGDHGGDHGDHGDDHGARGGEHGGHHAHHGHGGDMEMPGGLPMADLGEDRDGLTLDRLHVPLGPVVPDWPAGLVLRVTLQGDVIQEAAAEMLDAPHGTAARSVTGSRAAVRELDGLARFLGVTGWGETAARARRIRDKLLAGASPAEVRGDVETLLRRVRHSRTLRWLVRGIPVGSVDVATLLEQRLDAAQSAVQGAGAVAARPGVQQLPDLLIGAELAVARLIVAAVDPDTEPVAALEEVRHG